MTVAALLQLIQILSGLGSVSVSIIKIKEDLEKRKPQDEAPPEHISTVTQELWDSTHAPE